MYDPGRTSTYPSLPPEQGFRFHCLGGGDEVGNVGIMMEDPSGTKLLLDYGLAPTDPPRYPNEAPRVTDAVITHSHIDHLGMAPWLAAQHGTAFTVRALPQPFPNRCGTIVTKCPPLKGIHLLGTSVTSTLPSRHGRPMAGQNHGGTARGRALSLGRSHSRRRHAPRRYWRIPRDVHGDFDTRDSPLVAGAAPQEVDILFSRARTVADRIPIKRKSSNVSSRVSTRLLHVAARPSSQPLPTEERKMSSCACTSIVPTSTCT